MVPMAVAGTVYFADKNALKGSLLNSLVVARPTAFLGVPRVWEKIHEKMMAVARSNGPIKTWIATWAKTHGLQYNMNKMNGMDYKSWGYVFAKAIVFNKIKANLGFDRCKLFITGAAPLSFDIQKYFMSLDIPLMEVYGMSESTGGHSLNTNENFRLEIRLIRKILSVDSQSAKLINVSSEFSIFYMNVAKFRFIENLIVCYRLEWEVWVLICLAF